MNKILLVVTIILGVVSINLSSHKETTFFNNEKNIKVKKDDQVNNVKLEDYVIGVVSAEMPASFNIEALKAQAIASRTYAIYKMETSNANYDVIASVSNQGYITQDEMKIKWGKDYNKYYNIIKNSVLDTKGLVMKYNNKVIESYYFAMSNGYTENSELVFSESKDYLVSVPSKYDNNSLNNFKKIITYDKNLFCTKLNIDCTKININNIERSNTHRVNNISINNKLFKGTELRKLLDLRSTDFEISIDNSITITTYGYGHGVGMSQYGANGMANDGYKYEDILKYYYNNIEISQL